MILLSNHFVIHQQGRKAHTHVGQHRAQQKERSRERTLLLLQREVVSPWVLVRIFLGGPIHGLVRCLDAVAGRILRVAVDLLARSTGPTALDTGVANPLPLSACPFSFPFLLPLFPPLRIHSFPFRREGAAVHAGQGSRLPASKTKVSLQTSPQQSLSPLKTLKAKL